MDISMDLVIQPSDEPGSVAAISAVRERRAQQLEVTNILIV